MRLSTKSRYGLRALCDISYQAGQRPAQIQDIARRQGISPRYLEQIFQKLKRAGILKSKRGPQGGYLLARNLREITVRDVVKATEGDLLLVDCKQGRGRRKSSCTLEGHCITQTVWDEATRLLDGLFTSITLRDLCERGEAMGLEREEDPVAARRKERKGA